MPANDFDRFSSGSRVDPFGGFQETQKQGLQIQIPDIKKFVPLIVIAVIALIGIYFYFFMLKDVSFNVNSTEYTPLFDSMIHVKGFLIDSDIKPGQQVKLLSGQTYVVSASALDYAQEDFELIVSDSITRTIILEKDMQVELELQPNQSTFSLFVGQELKTIKLKLINSDSFSRQVFLDLNSFNGLDIKASNAVVSIQGNSSSLVSLSIKANSSLNEIDEDTVINGDFRINGLKQKVPVEFTVRPKPQIVFSTKKIEQELIAGETDFKKIESIEISNESDFDFESLNLALVLDGVEQKQIDEWFTFPNSTGLLAKSDVFSFDLKQKLPLGISLTSLTGSLIASNEFFSILVPIEFSVTIPKTSLELVFPESITLTQDSNKNFPVQAENLKITNSGELALNSELRISIASDSDESCNRIIKISNALPLSEGQSILPNKSKTITITFNVPKGTPVPQTLSCNLLVKNEFADEVSAVESTQFLVELE